MNLPFPPSAGGDPTGVTVVTNQAIYDAKNLPPLTPEVVYVQQVLFSQDLR